MIPSGIVTTGWPQVVAKGRELGLGFDWWQDSLGRVVLGKRKDGKYAATVGGVVLSIPRQVGKTYFVGALLMIMCILFPGLKVVWTAHRTRTATNTFRSLQGMARRKRIAPHIAHIRTANGEQEIAFRNGSVIMFGAREQGFGRGFDEVDIIVFDEAQILTEKALEDMVAATNQARHLHGALLFYMGTPPRPIDPGEAFTLKRKKALSGKSKDMVYLECAADPDADPDDRAQWAKANFSYPQRTPLESMLRLRENLVSDEAWLREALGIWSELDATDVAIDLIGWADSLHANAPQPDRAAMVLDVPPGRRSASLGLASDGPEGRTLLMVHTAGGTGWVVPKVKDLIDKRDLVECECHGAKVALHPSSQAGTLIPALTEAGIKHHPLTTQELGQACGAFIEGVAAGAFAHVGQRELDAAVANAKTRHSGEAELWDRRKRDIDISPLVACSAAAYRWGIRKPARKPMATFV